MSELKIIPVINKIDMPSADIDQVKTEIENRFGIDESEVIGISAKTGQNVKQLLEQVIE